MTIYSWHDWIKLTSELNHLLQKVKKYQDWYYYNREGETLFYHGTKVAEGVDGAHAFLTIALQEYDRK